MSMLSMILFVLKISIVLSVFAFGLNSTLGDATYMFRHPRDLARALLSMYVLMPLLALGMAMGFHLDPPVQIALVALAVSPVPPIFSKKAEKAGGSDDYSIGLLVATGVLSVVIIPITMKIFENMTGIPLHTPIGSVAALVLTTVLLPLLAGIAVRAASPRFAERAAHPIGKWAAILLIVSLLPVLVGSIRTILSLIGNGTVLSFAIFALVGYAIGDFFGRPEFEKRRVLSLATASRHPAIAVAIAHANFPEQKLALPAIVLYLLVSAVVTGFASKRKPAGVAPGKPQRQMAA